MIAVLLNVVLTTLTGAAQQLPDNTCFQTASPYAPELDIASDVAIVYGVNESFADRVAGWRAYGYTASMMTGIAWGGYEDYYMTPDGLKKAEIQTDRDGNLFMHGNSKTVGYNVPTQAYIDYIKQLMAPAVEQGVQGVYLEEPEYWARTGWSDAFKEAWAKYYGEPWQPPDSSVDAQYRASRLKYELYFEALRQVFEHVDALAREKGIEVECHVPTHSLINYAHWRIVSPESHLIDIPQLDGYVAQVWTGTARTPNVYGGVSKERTFETAYFEYGQMLAMVRPTGKKVWFLHDPVEDNPDRSWDDYKRNYECTVIASLMWPQVHRFEVMPWPDRIFRGKYANVDMDTKTGDRAGIPAGYATEILTIINALNEMNQEDVRYDTGTQGIGVIVSDTMMFQRAEPTPSCPALGFFHGLALPLLKAGVPVEVVQLENATHPDCLKPYRVLLLTYEGQKPLKPEYHDALAAWVREGGCLLYFGDDSDPYHHVREWWNENGKTAATPKADLFARLGYPADVPSVPAAAGKGYVFAIPEHPAALQHKPDGPEIVCDLVNQMLACIGGQLETRNYLSIRRGPFVVASVLDESTSAEPLRLEGTFVDLFDPSLPVVNGKVLQPGERCLLYDIEYARGVGVASKVAACGARVVGESLSGNEFTFKARGPAGTSGQACLLLPAKPVSLSSEPGLAVKMAWDEAAGTCHLAFPNQPGGVSFVLGF